MTEGDGEEGGPTGRTFQVGTVADMTRLPPEVLPRFLAQLPTMIERTRAMEADLPGFAATLRARAPFPARLLGVGVFEAAIRRGMLRPEWTDDGVDDVTVTGRATPGGEAFHVERVEPK